MEQKFYRCEICGNIIAKVHDSKVPVVCCMQKMQELVLQFSGKKLCHPRQKH